MYHMYLNISSFCSLIVLVCFEKIYIYIYMKTALKIFKFVCQKHGVSFIVRPLILTELKLNQMT